MSSEKCQYAFYIFSKLFYDQFVNVYKIGELYMDSKRNLYLFTDKIVCPICVPDHGMPHSASKNRLYRPGERGRAGFLSFNHPCSLSQNLKFENTIFRFVRFECRSNCHDTLPEKLRPITERKNCPGRTQLLLSSHSK